MARNEKDDLPMPDPTWLDVKYGPRPPYRPIPGDYRPLNERPLEQVPLPYRGYLPSGPGAFHG